MQRVDAYGWTDQPDEQTLLGQRVAVARVLAAAPAAQTRIQLLAKFTSRGRWKARFCDVLKALEALGRARRLDDGRWPGYACVDEIHKLLFDDAPKAGSGTDTA